MVFQNPQLDTFTTLEFKRSNALDSAAGSNSWTRRIQEGLAIIEASQTINKWLRSLLRNKEKLEEIAITTVNAECSAIIMNKVPKKLKDPGKFLIPCALQELKRTSALADSGASINLLIIFEKFADELAPLDSLPPEGDYSFSMIIYLESEDSLSDPLHHEFAGEPLTLPARNDREFEEYLKADSEDEVNESPNLDHQDDPSIPRPHRNLRILKNVLNPKAGL
ncbi:hypothetical protein Tco_0349750 [Tanacetum coccineum]